MHDAFSLNWPTILLPTVSITETIVRGSVMYLFVFFLLRLFRRESGSLSTADLLVIVFVADAAQNAMAAQQNGLADGIVLVATIVMWNYIFDFLSFRYRWAYKLINPRPVLLVENGAVNWQNLRRQMITKDDLLEQLREHGIEDLDQVQKCFIESDGKVSVIRKE